jgi:hypothetical protein
MQQEEALKLLAEKQLYRPYFGVYAVLVFKASRLGTWQGTIATLMDSPKAPDIELGTKALARLEELGLIRKFKVPGALGLLCLIHRHEIMGYELATHVATPVATPVETQVATQVATGVAPHGVYVLNPGESSLSGGLVFRLTQVDTAVATQVATQVATGVEAGVQGVSQPSAPVWMETVIVPYPFDSRGLEAGKNNFPGSPESSNPDSIKSLSSLSLEIKNGDRVALNLKTEEQSSQGQRTNDPAADIIGIVHKLTTGNPEDSQFPVSRLIERWSSEADDLLRRCNDYDHVVNVITWALTQDSFWPGVMAKAKNPMHSLNKNFEKIEDGFYASFKNQKSQAYTPAGSNGKRISSHFDEVSDL